MRRLILASSSSIRKTLLENAGVSFDTVKARVDEEMAKSSLINEGASPRDISDSLAELKARKVSQQNPDGIVIGCDQVLAFGDMILSKAISRNAAFQQLQKLRGEKHKLYSAAVIYDSGQPIWRHVGTVSLTMRNMTDSYLSDYVERNWDEIQHCVGSYQLEKEGIRLFSRVDGDFFNVLGLPLLEILNYLAGRGDIPG